MNPKTKIILSVFSCLLALTLLAVSAPAVRADLTNGCPVGGTGNPQTSNLVGASYTVNGNNATYYFDSFVDRNPVDGVPGLIEYCIYPDPATQPDSVVVVAKGADGSDWQDPFTFDNFSFQRPDGNPSNIPLDGTAGIEMGTATWGGGVPASQTILLHINDAAECDALYGGNPGTCFVLPGSRETKQPPVPPTITKNATGSYDLTYGWTIKKDVDHSKQDIADGDSATFNYTITVSHDDGTASNISLSGQITVNNPNTDSITGADVTDAVNDPNASCSVSGGAGATLAPGDNVFDYTCTYSQKPASDNETNTATVTWQTQTLPDYSPDLPGGSASKDVGFTFSVNTIDECVTVTDSSAGNLGQVCVGGDNPKQFTYSRTENGNPGTCTDYDNTATFTTNDTGATDSASQTVKVCVGVDLTVSKNATPSFKRTYNWDIKKSVDKTLVQQIGGGTATFNYTVVATETGFTDSNWKVKGTITVHNPNDWEAITFDLSDAVDNGGSCSIDGGGTGLSVAASSDATADYTCTYASAPSPSSGTNTATATWNKDAYHTPDGSASGDKGFAFGDPTTRVNQTVTITDTFNSVTTTLGTLTATDSTPFASATYTYSHTVNVPTNDCKTYDNTAKIVETGQSDSKTVKVCGPATTGALTIGFWKTTNGQNLVKTYCKNGTNWLGTYLAGLGAGSGPFSDAPSGCTNLATYVLNILNAASASNMNKMLKAQMLGTALDVWFSGPGWTSTSSGGVKPPSKFLSHNNLGTFNMDTTAVCPMVDNLNTGSATCQNNTPSTDAVAAGAVPTSPMSMQAILDYAATTPSPFNGSTSNSNWYNSNKTKEEILKNIFDQFNNQLAFGSF